MKNAQHLVLITALLSCVVIAFSPACAGDWLIDDLPLILQNSHVHGLTAENIRWAFTHDMWDVDQDIAQLASRIAYYRPLVLLSYAFDWSEPPSSLRFHLTNLALHLLVIVLAARALGRWTGSATLGWLGGAAFGLHPARVESVSWVSGRPDPLATLGVLCVLEGVALAKKHGATSWLLVLFGTAVAYLSKETSIVLLALVAIEVWAHAGRPTFESWRDAFRLDLKPVLAHGLVALVYLGARRAWLPIRSFEMVGLSLESHVGFVFETLGRYVHVLLWPTDLSLFGSSLRERGGAVAPDWSYAALGVATALLALGLLFVSRRRTPRLLALLLTAGLLVPTLNLVWIGGISLMSPRFLYLPSLGVVWLVLELARSSSVLRRAPRVAAGVGGALIVALTCLTLVRSLDFTREQRFWLYELRRAPDAPFVVRSLGQLEARQGFPEDALARYLCGHEHAERSFGYSGTSAHFIADALRLVVRETADAERSTLESLARFLGELSRGAPEARLEVPFTLVVPRASKAARTLETMAPSLEQLRARLLVRLGSDDEALAALRHSLELCPRCTNNLPEAGWLALQAGDVELAERLLREAGALERPLPNGMEPRFALTRSRELRGRIASTPPKLRSATESLLFSELDLWGRAYEVMRPHEAEILAEGGEAARLFLIAAHNAGAQAEAERLAERLDRALPPARRSLDWPKILDARRDMTLGCLRSDELAAPFP